MIAYTDYLGDVPVTSGTLLDAGGCPAIYDLSTPAVYRGQGFGGALTHALMQISRQRGCVDVEFGVREHVWHRA